MGKKDDRYCFQYRLTNTKTGQIFEGRKWSSVIKMAGLAPSINKSTLDKRVKKMALGFAQDNIQILQNLMSYLECDGEYQNVNV